MEEQVQVFSVNGSMGTIQDILFEEQGPPSLPVVVFVNFDQYEGPTITTTEGVKVVPIVPIKRAGKVNPEYTVLDFRYHYVSRGQLQCIRVRGLPY